MARIRILQNGTRVALILDGVQVAEMPHQVAAQVADALRSVGKKAEEWEHAERLAQDQAILMRSGAPFGLTGNAAINEEALKRSQWDSELRRHMATPSILSREVFGTPTIRIQPPRKAQ